MSVTMKKGDVERMIQKAGDLLGQLVSHMEDEDIQQTISMMFYEGGFSKEEDRLITSLAQTGRSAEDIATELLALGEGNKHPATVLIQMLALGLTEKEQEVVS